MHDRAMDLVAQNVKSVPANQIAYLISSAAFFAITGDAL